MCAGRSVGLGPFKNLVSHIASAIGNGLILSLLGGMRYILDGTHHSIPNQTTAVSLTRRDSHLHSKDPILLTHSDSIDENSTVLLKPYDEKLKKK